MVFRELGILLKDKTENIIIKLTKEDDTFQGPIKITIHKKDDKGKITPIEITEQQMMMMLTQNILTGITLSITDKKDGNIEKFNMNNSMLVFFSRFGLNRTEDLFKNLKISDKFTVKNKYENRP